MVGGRGEVGWVLLHDGRRGGFPFRLGLSITEVGLGDGVRGGGDSKKPDRRVPLTTPRPEHGAMTCWVPGSLGPELGVSE